MVFSIDCPWGESAQIAANLGTIELILSSLSSSLNTVLYIRNHEQTATLYLQEHGKRLTVKVTMHKTHNNSPNICFIVTLVVLDLALSLLVLFPLKNRFILSLPVRDELEELKVFLAMSKWSTLHTISSMCPIVMSADFSGRKKSCYTLSFFLTCSSIYMCVYI